MAAVLAVVVIDEALVFSAFSNEAMMVVTMVKLAQEMVQPPVVRCARQETLVAVLSNLDSNCGTVPAASVRMDPD